MPDQRHDHPSGFRKQEQGQGLRALTPTSSVQQEVGVVDVSVDRPAPKPPKTKARAKREE